MGSEMVIEKRRQRSAEGNSIQVIARAADILRTLKTDNSGLSLGQISERAALPRSTVQRIVNALMAEELVAPNKISGGYQLGPEITAMALAARHDLLKSMHPIMERLSNDSGETVDLATVRSDRMVFVDQIVGTQRLRTVSAIGESFPMLVTANGKAALAMLSDDKVVAIYQSESSANLGRSLESIRTELADIRICGYALDRDEHTVGISAAGIAFSIGTAIYAVSIPAPTGRFKEKQEYLVEKLLGTKSLIKNRFPEAQFYSNTA